MAERLLGLRTVVYPAPDLAKAKDWYARLLGKAPYFDEPFYVGFNVGGFELGLDPDMTHRGPGGSGGHAYWGVEKIEAAVEHARSVGAEIVEPPHEVGGGIKVASVRDPFGNIVGLIENPHFPNTAP